MSDGEHAWHRWIVIGLGLVVAGGAAWIATPALASPRGALGPGLLQAHAPALALGAVVVVVALGTGAAIVVGRLTSTPTGLFVLGAGLAVLAGRTETIRELAFGDGRLGLLALDTALLAALLLGATLAVFRLAGPLEDVEPDEHGVRPDPLRSPAALAMAACGVAVLPVVWIVAQSSMKGQVLAAAFLGSTVAGLAGRLWKPHVQPVLLFATPCLFGAVGHLVGAVMVGGALEAGYVEGALPALVLPMPLDYAAGSLAGVATGLAWARSFLHHESPEGAAAAS